LSVPVFLTRPMDPPLFVPDLAELSSTAVIVPLSVPIDMPVIVPAPWAMIVPAMVPVTVTPVSVPPLTVPPLATLPIDPPLIVPEDRERVAYADIVPLSGRIDITVIGPAPSA